MARKNALYAQSGGVTAVINASACGVIQTAQQFPEQINRVYAGRNGILGVLNDDLIDTYAETPEAIAALRHTPSGAFGSCRYKLKGIEENRSEYERLIEVFSKHNIGYFLYNGGGDSQDTTHKLAEFSQSLGYPLQCIGIPKTIDNDLPLTDNSPGFGSVAKYVAVSIREAGFDVASMAATSTKVFILEVMGRHTGWITAASALSAEQDDDPPHLCLFPEIPLITSTFLDRVQNCVKTHGYCALVVSEGVKNTEGGFLAESGQKDAFGHSQLGGVAPQIAQLISQNLGYKYHWAVSDYLQRAARHIASKTDVDQAYALGEAAVKALIAKKTGVMMTIERLANQPYQWGVGEAPLSAVANQEKFLPRDFITQDGFGITEACRRYLAPLIQGEDYPPYKNGLPDYIRLQNLAVTTSRI